MSEVKRVWTAEEILEKFCVEHGILSEWRAPDKNFAQFLAECTRLRAAFDDRDTGTAAIAEAIDDWDAHAASAGIAVERYEIRLRAAMEAKDEDKR